MWDRRTRASKPRLKVSKRRSGDSWVKVQGELDLTTVDELEVELEPRNGTLVILDLSGVERIDAAGIALLVRYSEGVVIGRASAYVRNLLATRGLEQLMPPSPAAG